MNTYRQLPIVLQKGIICDMDLILWSYVIKNTTVSGEKFYIIEQNHQQKPILKELM